MNDSKSKFNLSEVNFNMGFGLLTNGQKLDPSIGKWVMKFVTRKGTDIEEKTFVPQACDLDNWKVNQILDY